MSAEHSRIPTLLLVGACALIPTRPVFGQAHSKASEQAAEEAVPEGLSESISKGDWAGIRAAYEAGRHAAYSVAGGYEARNPGQRWRTHFDRRGFLTRPDAGGWTWGLELERYGFAGSEQAVTTPARVSAEGGRVAYAWDATLEEWYVNDTRGLEHGYTVHRRPARSEQNRVSPLTFTLAVRGELQPRVAADGRGIRFVDEGGAVVLTYSGLSVLDADGRELEASFEVLADEGDTLLLSVHERGARYPLVIDPIAQQAYLKAFSTDAGDSFGRSVAVSGETVVVGARSEDSSATGVNGNHADNSAQSSGAAYVFVRNGADWIQEAYLKGSNAHAGDVFGTSVAISGDTAVVGALGEDSSATGVNGNEGNNSAQTSGAAYVFVRSGTSWSQEAYLKASNTDADDRFGISIAVSGDTVVVGAYYERSNAIGVNGNQGDNSAVEAGAAYVFVRSGTDWNQEAYLKASNTDAGDLFGYTVSVSGSTAVVGAYEEDSKATGVNVGQGDNSALASGAAYVFVRSGTNWNQEAYLKASDTDRLSYFGISVAVSDATVVIGSNLEDGGATGVNGHQSEIGGYYSGAAYVFVRSGTSWSQEAYLKASNTDHWDAFGGSVAVSGDTIVVGAPGEDSNASGLKGNQDDDSAMDAGAAYVFVRVGTTWSQAAYLKASNTDANDWFGWSVAVSGGAVVVGAFKEASNATGANGNQSDNSVAEAGAAYVYFLPGSSTSYCIALANSTGTPAHIRALGSAIVFTDLWLRAEPVPANQTGIFFYGPEQTQVPFGNGFLCVAPGATGIARLPVVQSNAFEVMTHHIDFSAPPTAATQITAGSTWNFQAWFRDPLAGPAFFNLSDGLSVTFGP